MLINPGALTDELIDDLVMDNWPKGEKIANKDIKLRTFISQESGRAQLVSHVYDITYGVVKEEKMLWFALMTPSFVGPHLNEYSTNFRPFQTHQITDCFHRTADSLSGLLWYRYV